MRLHATVCGTVLLGLAVCAAEQVRPGANPGIAILNSEITLYASFDTDTAVADLANGGTAPLKITGKMKTAPGRYGKAIVLGGPDPIGVHYPLFRNINLAAPGALSFWIAPQTWVRRGEAEERPYLFLLTTYGTKGGVIHIERMGFAANPKRDDVFISGYFGFPGMKNAMNGHYGTIDWEPGRWHLFVMNWDRNGCAASMDGGPLQRAEFSRPITAEDFPQEDRKMAFVLGCGGPETTLVDELVFYRRPLDETEIAALFSGK